MAQITVNIPDGKYEFFMELFQKLGLNTSIDFPSMTKEQIIEQAILAEKEIEQGKTIPHDQLVKEYKKW